MPLLDQLLSESYVRAIAHMLFHSIWQGLLLAAAAGMVMLFTRKSTAALRYNLLISMLFLFAAGSVYTWKTAVSHIENNPLTTDQTEALVIAAAADGSSYSRGPVATALDFFHSQATLIVFVWLLIITIRLCFIMRGYYTVHRLVRSNLTPPSVEWQERWAALGEQMHIRVPARLMESALAKVPMVIGHLRPLVLVPAGMLMSLPPQEAEAILLHELAHIKRRDYLVNLIQQGIECIFFFHPAVVWVSALISEEREHCCDDIATAQNDNKRTYINALVSFYEKTLTPETALGFAGRNQSLMDRIKRLINHRNKTLNLMEKIFLSVALVAAGFFVQAYQQNNIQTHRIVSAHANDTIPGVDEEKNMQLDHHQSEKKTLSTKEQEKRAKKQMKDSRKAAEKSKVSEKKPTREVKIKQEPKSDNSGNKSIEADVQGIVQEAMELAATALQEIRLDETTSIKINQEVQQALIVARQEMENAKQELAEELRATRIAQKSTQTERQKTKSHQHGLNHKQELAETQQEFAALSQEVVKLALQAAQLGLQEANAELQANIAEPPAEKMDRKEYKQRKKELRDQYKNSREME